MNYYKKNTALETVKKRKIAIIMQNPNNNICFECSKINPDFISINNAIFLCKDCVKNHLKLPKSISNIIPNNINNLSNKNIQYLAYGGNKNLNEFILNDFPDLYKLSPNDLYRTYALDYYRKLIEYLVEGGIKPIKPEGQSAYDLIKEINSEQNADINYNPKRNHKLIRKIKTDSFIKYRNNPYPKRKPIIGINSISKFTNFSNQNRNNTKNKLSQTTTNLTNNYKFSNISLNENNYYHTHTKINSSDIDNKRTFYPNFRDNYDIDDDSNFSIKKGTIYNNSIPFKNINLREKILRKNDLDNELKILNSNPNKNNNIYAKYMTQNYFNNHKKNINKKNLYRNDNSYNINRNNKTTIFNYQRKRNINNMELRAYLQNKYRENENYILNLKLNSAKPSLINNLNEKQILEAKNNSNINNINNNIIINRNLNVFYNNDNNNNNNSFNTSAKIFQKKQIGNSFSINEKRNSFSDFNNLNNKLDYFINQNNSENIFNNQNNPVKKIIRRNDKNKIFIKVNKVKTISKTNQEFKIHNDYINEANNKNISKNEQIINQNNSNNNKNNNDKKYYNKNNKESQNQESMIIQRISRVIKKQKEKKEKIKQTNEIKNLSQNSAKYKIKILKVEKINNKNKKQENIQIASKNNDKNIKFKIYKRNDKSFSDKNLIEPRKTNHTLMKELNNLPSGKKKSILEIIKTNILANKSVSPGVKRLLKISNEDNF